jgi:hypothetical protein
VPRHPHRQRSLVPNHRLCDSQLLV